jgi:lipoprotein-anchoring transpeptidase ErfK/SrfK
VSAVLAFEKREGLPRDGIAGPVVLGQILAPVGAGPRPNLPIPRIEIDIARQIAFVILANAVWTLNVSTGSGLTYQDPTTHATDVATTPVGTFRVERAVNQDVQAPLGTLHRPLYFYQGWAVHGAASVPAYPASHGCVRVSDVDADWLFPLIPVGTTVVIYDTTGRSPGAGQVPAGAAPGY